MVIQRAINRLLRHVVPEPCQACGEATTQGPLCDTCRAALRWNDCACPRCALPLPAPAPLCGRCVRRTPPQSATLAPLMYVEPVDQLLLALKFGQRLAAGRALSMLMAEHPDLPELLDGIDLAVPMPLHRQRLRERGYNQALELLRLLPRGRAIPLLAAALARHRSTVTQTGLDAAARRRNVRDAFRADPTRVGGRRVLLVDDVITTSSTVAEAARTLLRAGALEVRVLAAARVARG